LKQADILVAFPIGRANINVFINFYCKKHELLIINLAAVQGRISNASSSQAGNVGGNFIKTLLL